MSQWTDRVQNHAVWEHIRSLVPALDQALDREDIDPSATAGIERVRSVLTLVGKRLAAVDPQLVYTPALDAIAGSIQAAVAEITAYSTDGAIGHIDNANAHADTVLGQLAPLNSAHVADDVVAMRDAIVAHRGTLETQVERAHAVVATLSAAAADVESRVADLTTAVTTESVKLSGLAVDLETRFAATIEQRLTELGTEVGAERARLLTVGTEFQSQFSTAQEARLREFGDAQTNRQEKFAALMADYTQRLSDQNAEFTKDRDAAFQKHGSDVAELNQNYADSAKTILAEIERHKADVEKLVGVIGNLGVTSGYQKNANYARKATTVWQGFAVLAMLGAIYFAFRAFLPLMQSPQQSVTFVWQNFAGRVVLTVAVFVLAAYAAAQSDKYFEMEQRNRRLALELEAIGRYLAPLPSDKQEAFRLQIGERTFGRDDLALGRKRAGKSPATALDVLMKTTEVREFILGIVTEAIQKVRPPT